MGYATKAMRMDGVKNYYKAEAFFFEVLVRVKCEQGLTDKSNLRFHLTFKQRSFLGSPANKLPDKVFEQIMKLSSNWTDPSEREYEMSRARKENQMTIVRPRSSSFKHFKTEVLNTLEHLEDIFHKLVSSYGSVMELSIWQGARINI